MSKEFTHAYCDLCEEIQEVLREELLGEDTTGRFGGGDIVCTVCGSVLSRFLFQNSRRYSLKPRQYSTSLRATTDDTAPIQHGVELAKRWVDKPGPRAK